MISTYKLGNLLFEEKEIKNEKLLRIPFSSEDWEIAKKIALIKENKKAVDDSLIAEYLVANFKPINGEVQGGSTSYDVKSEEGKLYEVKYFSVEGKAARLGTHSKAMVRKNSAYKKLNDIFSTLIYSKHSVLNLLEIEMEYENWEEELGDDEKRLFDLISTLV